MKLVLKHKDSIKLYSQAIDYDTLVQFIQKQFRIARGTLELSFLDQEGDNIFILNNDDVEVMASLFQGKDYVKVQVTGEVMFESQIQESKVEQVSEEPQEQLNQVQQPKQVEKIEIKEAIQIVKELMDEKNQQTNIDTKEQKPKVMIPQKAQERHQKKQDRHRHKWQKMMHCLQQKVSLLVDERLKVLLPCFKQQLFNNEKKVEQKDQSPLVSHEGYECKACLMNPIIGIRYQCLKCTNFNLCENCQAKIDHQHNLMKIKKLVKQEEVKHRGFFFNPHQSSQSTSKEKHRHHKHHGRHHKHHGHHGKQFVKAEGLTMMFGGNHQDYRSFIQQSRDLNPRQTYKKYAILKNLTQQQFNTKFIQYRCQKLSKTFGKPAQTYQQIVKNTISLRYSQVIDRVYENGIQVRKQEQSGRCKRWWGKRYNFNEQCQKQKIEVKQDQHHIEIKPEQKIQILASQATLVAVVQKKEQKIEQPKEQQKNEIQLMITQSMLVQPKPLDPPEVTMQKGRIFSQLRQIFGDDHRKDFVKLIDKYFKEGQQAIVERWIQGNYQL